MPCYKQTPGCGVYENRTCYECPYSKPPKDEQSNSSCIIYSYCNICGRSMYDGNSNNLCQECIKRLNKILYPEKE